jgi:hypothetical protein
MGGVTDAPSDGNTCEAVRQSSQPSRQTSESELARPSVIHLRIMSPRAGPYCPPDGGRTYQIACGASSMGSTGATAAGAAVMGAATGITAWKGVAGRIGTDGAFGPQAGAPAAAPVLVMAPVPGNGAPPPGGPNDGPAGR